MRRGAVVQGIKGDVIDRNQEAIQTPHNASFRQDIDRQDHHPCSRHLRLHRRRESQAAQHAQTASITAAPNVRVATAANERNKRISFAQFGADWSRGCCFNETCNQISTAPPVNRRAGRETKKKKTSGTALWSIWPAKVDNDLARFQFQRNAHEHHKIK